MSAKQDNVIHFEDYKRKRYGLDRPIFSEPTTVTLSDPTHPNANSQYTVICNVVHDDRQFFALERKDKPEKLYTLVRGITDRGRLVKVVPIEKEEYPEIKALFSKIFDQVNTK